MSRKRLDHMAEAFLVVRLRRWVQLQDLWARSPPSATGWRQRRSLRP